MTKIKNKKTKTIKSNKFKSFVPRLISGIFLILIVLFLLLNGGISLLMAAAIVSIIGLVELFRVFKLANSRLAYIGYLFTVFYYFLIYHYKATGILLFLISMLLLLLMFYVFSYPKFNIKQVAIIFFSIIYVAVMFSFIYLIRERNVYGKYFVWLVFICSWGSDTFAYCTGLLLGNNKLSPILSPNKTIEGAIGGIIGASILGGLYTYIVFYKMNDKYTFSCVQVAISCAIGAIISMIGDLTASAIKRDFNVKDYGNLIPGHGGILDRFDSVIFAAPAVYFILSL